MSVFDHPEYDDHEEVLFVSDPAARLRAIIAVHTFAPFGVAGGGCRMIRYATADAALTDVLRLSRAMSYKLALFDLPAGGAKSVIIADPRVDKTEALLRAFGRAVDKLGGHYVVAEDVGTTPEDMQTIGKETRYVVGTHTGTGSSTAAGVVEGIRAAVQARLGKRTLDGVRVAVQGLGSVGRDVCRRLSEEGAALVVADVDPTAVGAVTSSMNATVVDAADILRVETDVLAPCALGGVLDASTIPRLRCKVIAGSANNQLRTAHDADLLAEREILFAPDFVLNAGGVMGASHDGALPENADGDAVRKLEEADAAKIGDVVRRAFSRSENEHVTPYEAAIRMAKEKIEERRSA